MILDALGAPIETKSDDYDGFLHKLFNGKKNIVHLEIFRNGVLVDEDWTHNGITVTGKNSLLDVYFRNQTQLPAWYLGLISNTSPTINDTTDTMSSHAWTEITAYSESTRQQWSPGAAASGSITNSSSVTFTSNATSALYGMFVVSNSTKGGSTGVLWATAAFSSVKNVINGDAIKLTYTVSC